MIHEIFFLSLPFPPELFEGSSRACAGGAVVASSKSHISHITYHDFELASTAPPPGALGESPEGKGGSGGLPRS